MKGETASFVAWIPSPWIFGRCVSNKSSYALKSTRHGSSKNEFPSILRRRFHSAYRNGSLIHCLRLSFVLRRKCLKLVYKLPNSKHPRRSFSASSSNCRVSADSLSFSCEQH